jgi:hypothetical protein
MFRWNYVVQMPKMAGFNKHTRNFNRAPSEFKSWGEELKGKKMQVIDVCPGKQSSLSLVVYSTGEALIVVLLMSPSAYKQPES